MRSRVRGREGQPQASKRFAALLALALLHQPSRTASSCCWLVLVGISIRFVWYIFVLIVTSCWLQKKYHLLRVRFVTSYAHNSFCFFFSFLAKRCERKPKLSSSTSAASHQQQSYESGREKAKILPTRCFFVAICKFFLQLFALYYTHLSHNNNSNCAHLQKKRKKIEMIAIVRGIG